MPPLGAASIERPRAGHQRVSAGPRNAGAVAAPPLVPCTSPAIAPAAEPQPGARPTRPTTAVASNKDFLSISSLPRQALTRFAALALARGPWMRVKGQARTGRPLEPSKTLCSYRTQVCGAYSAQNARICSHSRLVSRARHRRQRHDFQRRRRRHASAVSLPRRRRIIVLNRTNPRARHQPRRPLVPRFPGLARREHYARHDRRAAAPQLHDRGRPHGAGTVSGAAVTWKLFASARHAAGDRPRLRCRTTTGPARSRWCSQPRASGSTATRRPRRSSAARFRSTAGRTP